MKNYLSYRMLNLSPARGISRRVRIAFYAAKNSNSTLRASMWYRARCRFRRAGMRYLIVHT